MQWYLDRGLARKIQDDPPRIQLLFDPKGPGHRGDPFFLHARENKCVVCGTPDGLTRHHILPHSYRRWFPRELDRYGTYDVMPLCKEHHEDYEAESRKFRRRLAVEFDAPIGGVGGRACKRTNNAVSAAFALRRYREQIPAERILKLEGIVNEFFGNESYTEEQLRELVRSSRTVHRSHSRMVVERLSGFEGVGRFTVRWREHFVSSMRPKFLPPYWKAGRAFVPE